jgi:heme/copper-type cytochrome/quinol oxidase subunit 4
MRNGTLPDVDPPVRPADLEQAGVWLAGHGLADVAPTSLLATRLAVRRRARLAASVLLAAFIIAVALTYVGGMADGSGQRRWLLLVLTALVVGLVVAQASLDWWVRRVDRRAGATLPRRAAYPVRLGWRTVLGWPRAAFAAVTFAGAAALAIGALTLHDPTARYAAVILLIGLCGVAVGTAVQLRHVLTHPVVADDEGTLKADFLMRVEDAREVALPTVVWSLPVVSVFDTGLDPWNTGWLAFIILSVIALALITARDGRRALAAQHHAGAR